MYHSIAGKFFVNAITVGYSLQLFEDSIKKACC